MIELLLKTLLAYLMGSLMGGLLVGRLKGGVDIRTQGSGNAGATNAWRTQGPIFGLLVFVIDVGKGLLAVLWLPAVSVSAVFEAAPAVTAWLPYTCGLAVMLGHVYPLWFGFRGGKGVATLIGVWACLLTSALPYALGAWVLTLVFTGYVSLASLIAGFALTVTAALIHGAWLIPPVLFALGTALLLVYTHRANLLRLRQGTESRVRRVMLFKPKPTD